MIKRIAPILPLIVIICFHPSCVGLKHKPELPPTQITKIINLKVYYKSVDSRMKGKISWRETRQISKLMVYTPLNTAVLELYITDRESATLFNLREKTFWKGKFSALIQRYWNLNLNFRELKNLVFKGIIPSKKLADNDLRISVIRDSKTYLVKTAKIFGRNLVLRLRIYKRRVHPTSMIRIRKTDSFRVADIENVINHD